jgi:prepilin-type N-terminal cleavage/methylation domain-containing protein
MNRRGMTLVEMLVAVTATLVLMTAVAQIFGIFGDTISGSRAVLELDGRMRNAAWRLRSDLAGATARTLPPLAPDSGEGYFEIIEGPATDAVAASGTAVGPADHDDVIMLTTRNTDVPFLGRAPTLGGTTIQGQSDMFESTLAEVVWFARPTPGTFPTTFTLYRRQLLVMGYVGADPFHSNPGSNNTLTWVQAGSSWSAYFNLPCDVSVRRQGSTLFPNTLADLTRRENRFMHNVSGITSVTAFPYLFVDHQAATPQPGLIFDTTQRQGEDVILTNVIAFDVRVFDPGVTVFLTSGNTALVPGDPGFADPTVVKTGSATGAYVDLGHTAFTNGRLTSVVAGGTAAKFAGFGQPKSGLMSSGTATRRTYDTWSLHYEANGLDEDQHPNAIDDDLDGVVDEADEDYGPDQGTDGIDNENPADGMADEPAYDANGDGVFEDFGETETLPPYPVPLRGIEVRIRCYEPASRQVRQVTVRHTFVPH